MTTAVASQGFLPTVRELVALTKPRVTWLVLATTACGMAVAPHSAPLTTRAAAMLATLLVVASANSLNCWLERDLDRLMTRTRNRPLPAGRLNPRIALFFGLALGAISVPLMTFLVNPVTGLLAAVALVSYVWIYTPMKQHTPAALLVGAIPGAMPPLMGWTAMTGALDVPGLLLFGVLFLWQLPHFIAISVFRQHEYTAAGLKVLPAVRGEPTARRHAVMYAAALLPVTLLLVPAGLGGRVYFVVALVLGLVFFASALRSLAAEGGERWARRLFVTSLFYLPLLMAALVIDTGR
jgi:protoheme IX farnesyltransferase